MQLVFIDLADNRLTGVLPDAWGNLTRVSPVSQIHDAVACLYSSSTPVTSNFVAA